MSQGTNISVLVGHITAPALGAGGNDAPMLKFNVAVNETVGPAGNRRQKVDWIPVRVWGAYAKTLSELLHKGQLVSITGKNRTFRHKGGGFGFHVEADRVSLLGRKPSAQQHADAPSMDSDFEALFGAIEEEVDDGKASVPSV